MIYSVNEGGFRVAYSSIREGFVFVSARLLKKREKDAILYMNIYVSILKQEENTVFDMDLFSDPIVYGWGSCGGQSVGIDEFMSESLVLSFCLNMNCEF